MSPDSSPSFSASEPVTQVRAGQYQRNPGALRALDVIRASARMSWLALGAHVALAPLLGGLALPCLVFGTECCLARAAPDRKRTPNRPRAAVLVPAHDEAAGIGGVVASLRAQIGEGDRLLVVADNCTDDTASIARAAGAEVIERRDSTRRGKGFAISFALEHLAVDAPEVVVIVDADCELAEGALDALVSEAARLDRPVQADYLLEAPPGAHALTRISAFAVLVRNRVRPLGLHRLGLPCQLTGSGMAFPWRQLAEVPSMGDNIVEDLALGLNLAMLGHAPRFCPQAKVRSQLPENARGARSQRRRWETGQLATLLAYAPRLLVRGLKERRIELLALALDLGVPPLALLGALQVPGTLVGVGAGAFFGNWLPLGISALGTLGLGIGVAVAYRRFGRDTISLGDLARAPMYVVGKLGLYGSFLRRGQERTWVRTDRSRNP